jgi:hypothetical protein
LPTIHQQADVYLIDRVHSEEIVSVLYVDGQNQLLGPEQEFEEDEDTGSSANTEDQNSEARSSTGDNIGRWPTKAVNIISLYQRV